MSDFYIGRETGNNNDVLVKADSFTTHAFVLGMTGSGKTGLIISILEEAALNHIPAVVIDPKGDLTNRLLVFEGLDENRVAPYFPEGKRAEFVERYNKGISEWGIGQEKIAALAKRKVNVITPGISLAPVNILERFSPPASLQEDDILEKAGSVCASLLSLTGKKSEDAARDPEGLLLSTILIEKWKKGETATLESLLEMVVEPPFKKLGILPLDTVISKDKRVAFAVELNGVLSSPSLTYFKSGRELSLDEIFGDPDSETIFTLAQLSDDQKSFFLSLFLSELYLWVRRQPGSDRLKMLLVFDEVFGHFPPYPQNPPSKKPLLGLLKQARAFGLGVILSTQNPYDVDYKGLSNAGLWFLGRLQTDNDIQRVSEGLNEIAGGTKASSILPQIKQREFVLNDVRKDAPVVFRTRQAVSVLAGPLSEPQLKGLIKEGPAPKVAPSSASPARKELVITPAGVDVRYCEGQRLFPHILFESELPYKVGKEMVWEKKRFASIFDEGGLEASLAKDLNDFPEETKLSSDKPEDSELLPLPQWAGSFKRDAFEREIKEVLSLKAEIVLLKDGVTGLVSAPWEGRESFLLRVREERSRGLSKQMEKQLAPLMKKKQSLEDQIEKRQLKVERLKGDYEKRRLETYTNAGTSILRGIFGSKRSVLGGIGSTMSKNRMADSAKDRMEEEETLLRNAQADLKTLEEEITSVRTGTGADIGARDIEEMKVLPYKTGIRVLSIGIVFK
ncbi:MAG TPA: DUF87 domain-containing protein [Acidobacteriota bacterium]|nr:DUF87 domain-containing protein [Acidobacteriota bacterium]HQO19443.1 DUF87 domain-containing protein [Acidobacteriota bacterium]HQQ46119.1 DUF87 domain-containing protein [Acidobacteriota bacterium]